MVKDTGNVAMYTVADIDPWHELLTSRYVCEICLTRYFSPHYCCPACHQFGRIRPLVSMLLDVADNEEELRTMIAQGQTFEPPPSPPEHAPPAEAPPADFDI
jgi:hypothetical protein